MAEYPQIYLVRQQFQRNRVEDIAATVQAELARLDLADTVRPGQSVAITAGSRGIACIDTILKAAVDYFKQLGAEPFLVPAMGSHGGGTAEGQVRILASYQITPQRMGCPIRASMDTEVVCQAEEGFPVHFDRHALAADHVLVCGRIKPHTGFVGDIESGLMKMMLIGLGKHAGAKLYHRAIRDYSFGKIVRSVAREVLDRCRIVAGLAIVENGYDETAQIEAVAPDQFETREKQLLQQAKQLMPGLPFPQADLLLIDQIGKNISGTGMDTNVVGRKYCDHMAVEHEYPKIRQIAIRGLTQQTHGNATGIGLAEYCLTRAVEQMDVAATRTNCLTGGHITGAMIPLDYPTDRQILDAALSVIGLTAPHDARLMWISNTLHVAQVACSAAYFEQAQSPHNLEVVAGPIRMPLDEAGNLCEFAEIAWS